MKRMDFSSLVNLNLVSHNFCLAELRIWLPIFGSYSTILGIFWSRYLEYFEAVQ